MEDLGEANKLINELSHKLQICVILIEELSHGCQGDPENIVSDCKRVLKEIGYEDRY